MKKFALCLMTICLLLAFQPFQLKAETTAPSSSLVVPNPAEAAEAKVLLLRLDEINSMDKSNLKPSDKKDLRKEVRSIKQQLKDLGDGVYISVGAIIIILLLVIILL